MKFLFRSLLQISDKSDLPKPLDQLPEEWRDAAAFIDSNCTYNGDITFIIGPWGSGKSTFISTFLMEKEKFKNIHNPLVTSLSTATNEDEVFSHLISPDSKFHVLWIAYCLSLVFFGIASYSQGVIVLGMLSPFIAYFTTIFVTKRSRLTYIVSSILESRTNKTIKIIEDFDRGALGLSAIYNTLQFRYRRNTSYIVAFGYSSILQRDQYIEAAMKLNGKILFFDLSEQSLFKILSKTTSNPPINSGKWITCFPARKLISLALQYEKAAKHLDGPDKFVLFVDIFFEALEKAMNLDSRGGLDFASNGRHLSNANNLTNEQTILIESFLAALNPGELNSAKVKHLPNSDDSRIFLINLIRNRSYKNVVRPTVEISGTEIKTT